MTDTTPQPSTTPDAPQTCVRCGHDESEHYAGHGCDARIEGFSCECNGFVAPTSITPEQPAVLSDTELAEIRERAEKATPGPWDYTPVDDAMDRLQEGDIAGANLVELYAPYTGVLYRDGVAVGVTTDDSHEVRIATEVPLEDAEFIMHARDDIPRLLAHVSTLQHQLDSLRGKEG